MTIQAARHVPLVKIREKLPSKLRRKPKYQDEPRVIRVMPGTPEFPGRMLVEVNSANGPRALEALIDQWGPQLPVQHVTAALSRLAGWSSAGGLTPQQERCKLLLGQVVGEGEPLELARAAYSLYRLGDYDEGLLSDVAARSLPRLGSFAPDALAGLVAALGGARHPVPGVWLERACLEVYARLPRYSAQDLASVVYGLARLGHQPSEAWLAGVLSRFREAASVAGANAPSFVKLIWGLATMEARPSFNWMAAFLGEARARIDGLRARELATLVWASAKLGHTPDPLFADSWYRCATRAAPNFTPAALVEAIAGAARCRLGAPGAAPAKWVAAMLARTRELLPQLSATQQARLLWSFAVLRVAPDELWMDAYMEASEASVATAPTEALVDAAWAFARLRYQPSEAWVEAACAKVTASLPGITAPQLGVLLWSWRSVQLDPPLPWLAAWEQAAGQAYGRAALKDVAALLEQLQQQQGVRQSASEGGPVLDNRGALPQPAAAAGAAATGTATLAVSQTPDQMQGHQQRGQHASMQQQRQGNWGQKQQLRRK